MKPRNDNVSTISGNLNPKRKIEVLMSRANVEDKLAKHVMPTYDRETGQPDGGTKSAFMDPGGVCRMCGVTRADVVETKEGRNCDVAAFRKFSAPLEIDGPAAQRTINEMVKSTPARRVSDPLEGVFA